MGDSRGNETGTYFSQRNPFERAGAGGVALAWRRHVRSAARAIAECAWRRVGRAVSQKKGTSRFFSQIRVEYSGRVLTRERSLCARGSGADEEREETEDGDSLDLALITPARGAPAHEDDGEERCEESEEREESEAREERERRAATAAVVQFVPEQLDTLNARAPTERARTKRDSRADALYQSDTTPPRRARAQVRRGARCAPRRRCCAAARACGSCARVRRASSTAATSSGTTSSAPTRDLFLAPDGRRACGVLGAPLPRPDPIRLDKKKQTLLEIHLSSIGRSRAKKRRASSWLCATATPVAAAAARTPRSRPTTKSAR